MDIPPSPLPAKLRIIIDEAHDPDFNMAADRYLLDCAAGNNPVILRIYSWASPTITLGCMQKTESLLDAVAMQACGVGWISRITGGRAVLHWNDLTYSCAFPVDRAEMGHSIVESYAVICRCLAAGLQYAGIVTESHDSPAEHAATARNLRLPCFCSPNRNELMVHGRKLVGSAQKRTKSAVLQHGSIPLDEHFCRLGEFMAAPPEERERLCRLLEMKCTSVKNVAPMVGKDFLAKCLAKGFTERLPFEAYEQAWTLEETSVINRIVGM